MSDLEVFANKFKTWRGDRRHYQYPKHFWDEIRNLANRYSLPIIAQTLNINLSYLKLKLGCRKKQFTFVPLEVTSLQASIEFTDHHCHLMTIRFQANYEQLINMILSLSSGTR